MFTSLWFVNKISDTLGLGSANYEKCVTSREPSLCLRVHDYMAGQRQGRATSCHGPLSPPNLKKTLVICLIVCVCTWQVE